MPPQLHTEEVVPMPADPGRAGRAPEPAHGRLRAVIEPVVDSAGFDLEDVTVQAVGRRSVVRVVVDADDGVNLDAVADISRAVSAALDEQTPGGAAFAGPYVLEVTSPGVDRPLTEPRHWWRARGRLVRVSVEGTELTGRVVDADDAGVTIGTDGGERRVDWAALGAGRVQVEFNRATLAEREMNRPGPVGIGEAGE